MAQTKLSRNAWLVVLGIVFLCVPLLLSIAWGAYLSDAAYRTLQVARNWGAPVFDSQLLTGAPLMVGLMAAAGEYAPTVGLVLSALGWSATAALVFYSLRAAGRPLAALITALLLVFNPLVVTTSGTEYSWVLALGWAALALTVFPWGRAGRATWLKLVLLLLLLGLHFNAATILFALVLLAVDVFHGRAGWLPFALVAAVSFLWGFLLIPRSGSSPTADPVLWLQNGAAFLTNRQLYWLYVPFVFAGLWDVWNSNQLSAASHQLIEGKVSVSLQQLFLPFFLWVGAAVLARDPMAPVLVAVTAVALAGLGAAWVSRKILASGRLEIDQQRAAFLVPILVALPLLLIAVINLWGLYTTRPVQLADLQDQAAAWLAENADGEAVLFAQPRVGYLAGRATIPAMVGQIRDDTVDEVYGQLLAHVPAYVVSENTFAWDYVTRTPWFQDRYEARAQFEDGYASDSPVTVWEYTLSPYDEGEREELQAVVNDKFALVGYQFEPQTITPGDDVYLTLYLQALEAHESGFTTVVHLSAADDGWVWAWREEWTPRSFPGGWWMPGQIIPERILLPTTEDLPLGAYDLQVFWRAGDERDAHWPVVRDGDDSVLDRVFLGYVNAPPPVDSDLPIVPVGARFSDTIVLDSFAVSDLVPGETWQVDLFWDAVSTPLDDYTVFIHLLDAEGQIVASHDGMPVENRFPSTAWKPGQIVADRHQMDLPEELAPGTYQVNVGMYLLETGERLPVWDAGGVEQVDRSLPLTTIEIGE